MHCFHVSFVFKLCQGRSRFTFTLELFETIIGLCGISVEGPLCSTQSLYSCWTEFQQLPVLCKQWGFFILQIPVCHGKYIRRPSILALWSLFSFSSVGSLSVCSHTDVQPQTEGVFAGSTGLSSPSHLHFHPCLLRWLGSLFPFSLLCQRPWMTSWGRELG